MSHQYEFKGKIERFDKNTFALFSYFRNIKYLFVSMKFQTKVTRRNFDQRRSSSRNDENMQFLKIRTENFGFLYLFIFNIYL